MRTKKLTKNDQERMRDLLTDAQNKLYEVIDALNQYVRLTGDKNAEAYLEQQLRCHVDGGGMVSRDLTIEQVISRLDDMEIEDEDEENTDD